MRNHVPGTHHQARQITLEKRTQHLYVTSRHREKIKSQLGVRMGGLKWGWLYTSCCCCCLHVNHLQCVRNLRGLLIPQGCTTSHCVLIACLLDGNAFIITSCLFVQIVSRLFCSSTECWISQIIIRERGRQSGRPKPSQLVRLPESRLEPMTASHHKSTLLITEEALAPP